MLSAMISERSGVGKSIPTLPMNPTRIVMGRKPVIVGSGEGHHRGKIDNTQSGASAYGTSAENRDALNIHVEMVSDMPKVYSQCIFKYIAR